MERVFDRGSCGVKMQGTITIDKLEASDTQTLYEAVTRSALVSKAKDAPQGVLAYEEPSPLSLGSFWATGFVLFDMGAVEAEFLASSVVPLLTRPRSTTSTAGPWIRQSTPRGFRGRTT